MKQTYKATYASHVSYPSVHRDRITQTKQEKLNRAQPKTLPSTVIVSLKSNKKN
jgi:hypothetical protein